MMQKNRWLTMLLVALVCGFAGTGDLFALNIQNHYSPESSRRPLRRATLYIVLHTTEAPGKSSLGKLTENGEAHYMVDVDGAVYRIVDKRRVAYHCGVSMWEGHERLDDYSIGIEIVGYHNKPIKKAQVKALKSLISQLQKIYHIADKDVVTHSMVAYGKPNKWHPSAHRGRKRCGMQFASDTLRARLGLKERTMCDPDVKAGRLVVGDEELALMLYAPHKEQNKRYAEACGTCLPGAAMVLKNGQSPWDLVGDEYKSAHCLYYYPDGRKLYGHQITKWKAIPAGTRIEMKSKEKGASLPREGLCELGVHGAHAEDIAGNKVFSKKTVYVYPDGRVKRGDQLNAKGIKTLPEGTKILVEYETGGKITAKRSAFDVCADLWNDGDTYYRLPDKRWVSGKDITESGIPRNTEVFYRTKRF